MHIYGWMKGWMKKILLKQDWATHDILIKILSVILFDFNGKKRKTMRIKGIA